MKKILALGYLLLFSAMVFGQGISFTEGTWKEVVAAARKEHKLIYMDIYTTWCGPCKMMAAQIFPQPEAGTKYNESFVNYKIDAEKGEGLGLAKKYQVTGYPTNLYIDPQTENVVYRVMGSCDLTEFLKRADRASIEYKDPMKWDDYVATFKKGNRKKEFLLAYMEKAQRLDKYYDEVMDAYVGQFAQGKVDDATLKSLAELANTFDNKAVAIVYANKERVNQLFPQEEHFVASWLQNLSYNTLQKAIAGKEEKLLTLTEMSIAKYAIQESPVNKYAYRKRFFQQTGNKVRAWETMVKEADYFSNIAPATYQEENEKALPDLKASLRYQLNAMGTPEEKQEASIEATLKEHPEYLRTVSSAAAQALNGTAWKVVETMGDDKTVVRKALVWSRKSLDLTVGLGQWPMLADTYANLLWLNGEQQKAIAVQEDAIQKAEAMNMDGVADLKESLEKMKSK